MKKTFSQTSIDIYNQYTAFYEKNPVLAVTIGAIATISAAFSFIPTVAALAFVGIGHFFTDMFEFKMFASSSPVPSGTTTPPLEDSELPPTADNNALGGSTNQITQKLATSPASSRSTTPASSRSTSPTLDEAPNSGTITPAINPTLRDSSQQPSSEFSSVVSEPELVARERSDSNMSNNM